MLIQNSPDELRQAKDRLLSGVLGVIGSIGLVLLSWILTKLYDIDMRLARVETLKERIDKVEAWTISHDQAEREKFGRIGIK